MDVVNTSIQLREILYTGSQGMLVVLSSTVSSATTYSATSTTSLQLAASGSEIMDTHSYVH
jgi:hypothetical protein